MWIGQQDELPGDWAALGLTEWRGGTPGHSGGGGGLGLYQLTHFRRHGQLYQVEQNVDPGV
eukprot:COSAG01_NODE_11758_length_1864_cov_1.903116_1_plen_61_part_00